MEKHIIALDIGTTSTKAILYHIGRQVVGSQSQSYPTLYPREGFVEQDPEDVLAAVESVVLRLVQESGVAPSSIAALVFDGVWQSMIPVDRSGNPLTKAILWADQRAVHQGGQLRGELDSSLAQARTGCTIHPMYFLPKLKWFSENAPDILKKTFKFISIKEYVLYHLFGSFMVDRSIASGTGLLNMETLNWDQDLLRTIGLDADRFADIVETTTILPHGLKSDRAPLMGLLPGTPGIVGAADGATAHLGSVGLAVDRMSFTVGTGSALRKMVPSPRILAGQEAWCYYMNENKWLQGGVVHDAGMVMRWFVDQFISPRNPRKDPFELVNEFSQSIEPGANGLILFPLLVGERVPHHRPEARGCLYGLSLDHTVKHMSRAVMEGIAFRLYSVYKMLAGKDDYELVMTGGLLKSEIWLKIITDYFGKPLLLPDTIEASAWGAVLIGLRALGVIENESDLQSWVGIREQRDPDPADHEKYRGIHQKYLDMYRRVYEGE